MKFDDIRKNFGIVPASKIIDLIDGLGADIDFMQRELADLEAAHVDKKGKLKFEIEYQWYILKEKIKSYKDFRLSIERLLF